MQRLSHSLVRQPLFCYAEKEDKGDRILTHMSSGGNSGIIYNIVAGKKLQKKTGRQPEKGERLCGTENFQSVARHRNVLTADQ